MIDLHTHTVLSDGELLPFELARRAEALGLSGLAITDHVDASNIDSVVPALVKAVAKLKGHVSLDIVPGAEITHVPPALIAELVQEARRLGARIIVVHGETLAEPVKEGTNRAAIEALADILSHPGLISPDDARAAKEKGVALEITARKGHSISNGHVAKAAAMAGARMVINTDAHSPSDLIAKATALKVLFGAGLTPDEAGRVFENSRTILEKALRRTDA
ncbi:MAG: histidinol phosphate phosphatase domain-containing protein [Actinomycetota bacterium]|nr:histidinol phosphate phosphatase domain-containing protein [Actinomycetota bacterium]